MNGPKKTFSDLTLQTMHEPPANTFFFSVSHPRGGKKNSVKHAHAEVACGDSRAENGTKTPEKDAQGEGQNVKAPQRRRTREEAHTQKEKREGKN